MAFASMKYARSKADPCLYFSWTVKGLIVWISWVNDCLVCGKETGVLLAKRQMMDRFDCDEIGIWMNMWDANWKETTKKGR